MKTTATLAGLGLLMTSAAVGDPLFPSPSVPSIAAEDGWSFALGLGAEYEAEYDGSDDYSIEAEPGLVAQYRSGDQVWFLEGAEFGWRKRAADRWLLQAGLRLEGGREENEAPELAGLGDTDDELTAMVEVRRGFGDAWDNWVAGRIMAGGSDIGTLGVLAAGHPVGANRSGNGIDVFAFTTFGSSEFINRDFGIDATQSTGSGLPETNIDAGYRSVGVGAIGRWYFGEHWQLLAEAGYEKYSSDIADSPIALDDYEAEIGVNVFYTF